MVSFLLAALLSFASPAPTACAEQVVNDTTTAPRLNPAFLPPEYRTQLNWSVLGADYVKCEVEAGHVESILVLRNEYAVATLSDGTYVEFSLPSEDAGWFLAQASISGVLLKAGAEVVLPDSEIDPEAAAGSGSSNAVGFVLLAAVVIAGSFYFYRTRRRKKVAVHKVSSSNSPTHRPKSSNIPATKFDDVAGCKEAIEDLAEMVDVLKHPEKYTSLGAKTPRGALLVGPPGTGKTLLARAVAGEAEVPFFSAAGSDFVEMYVGVGAKRVRDVFERARKAGRAIVFIDEIDAVGRRRSDAVVSGGEQEHENTLIALLNELDGFNSSQVVVLAATNRPDILDPALTRPGRLDRKVFVPLPDAPERRAILDVHTRHKKLAEDLNLEEIARRSPGMSGAQLEQVCNEAALLAARARRSALTQEDFRAAVEYVQMGRARRSATVSTEDRKVTAWHEAGHTVAALKHAHAARPVAVSITPRGLAGGVTLMEGDDTQIVSRTQLRARLVVALAGRAAEEVLLAGEYTAGAANDLEQATQIARMMVERFGMSDLGLAVRPESVDSLRMVDDLVRTAHLEARELLQEHAALLESIAAALLEHSDLTADDLTRLETKCLALN
jgi:cell division protease FtsH